MSSAGRQVRAFTDEERTSLPQLLTREWGARQVVCRGRLYDAAACPALGSWEGARLSGMTTYTISGEECLVLTLNAFRSGNGTGSALLEAAIAEARRAGCRRLWLTTSNDNAQAIRFYESRGMRLAAVHHGAMDAARQLKPEIPEFAPDGTPVTDELEFELEL